MSSHIQGDDAAAGTAPGGTNAATLANLGIVLGFLGVITLGVLSLVGVFVSLAALKKGSGAALVGLIISLAVTIGWGVTFATGGAGPLGGVMNMYGLGGKTQEIDLTEAQQQKLLRDLAPLSTIIREYELENGFPPEVLDLQYIGEGNRIDPWGREYRYETYDGGAKFRIWSNGPDGIAGTTDDIDVIRRLNR